MRMGTRTKIPGTRMGRDLADKDGNGEASLGLSKFPRRQGIFPVRTRMGGKILPRQWRRPERGILSPTTRAHCHTPSLSPHHTLVAAAASSLAPHPRAVSPCAVTRQPRATRRHPLHSVRR
ncbi:hypothetical protein PIB30_089312, partial [Stylosanthes scabra]|nr:hypothetical protein [Stylosanthes scabra]